MDGQMFLELDGLIEEFTLMQQQADDFTAGDVLHQEDSEKFQSWNVHVVWLCTAIQLKQAHDVHRIANALEELARR